MGSSTSSTSFVHSCVPESDIFADVELLKEANKDRKKEITALTKTNKKIKAELGEIKKERDKAKRENERMKEVIQLYVETVNNLSQQDKTQGDVEAKWMEEENKHLIFFKLDEFFRHQRDRIIAETTDPQEIVTQLNRLEQCRNNAMETRGQNIADIAVIGGLIGGVLTPTVIVAGAAIAGKIAGAGVLVTVGTLLGSFAIGGVVVGLVLFGGMYLYAKWCDKHKSCKKNE